MKKAITLLAGSALFVNAWSQPTIDAGNFAPAVGQSYLYSHGSGWTDPGPTGENVVWDWSVLEPFAGSPNVDIYMDATAMNGASHFPNATLFSTSTGRISVDASGAQYWGYFETEGPPPNYLAATDASLVLPFPCTLGTTWTDNGAGEVASFDGGPYTSVLNGEGSGTGELILPIGSYSGVLRVDYMEERTVESFQTIVQRMYRTAFYIPGFPMPLAVTGFDSLSFEGGPFQSTSNDFTHFLDDASTLVSAREKEHPDVRVGPNPVNGGTTNVLLTGITGRFALDLFDAAGRTVLHREGQATNSATRREELDLSALQDGCYILTVRDGAGLNKALTVAVAR